MDSSLSLADPRWRQGIRLGLKRSWEFLGFLLRVVVPWYVAAAILEKTGLLGYLSGFLAPVMGVLGLPPEAAVAITAGWVAGLYPVVAVTATLNLSPAQVSIVGIMAGLAHALPVEGAVVAKLVPDKHWRLILLRVGLSFVAGYALKVILL